MALLAPLRVGPRPVLQATRRPNCCLNDFVKAKLDILNADTAQFATLCRYFTHEDGNVCLFGDECRYLHPKALERPRQCAEDEHQRQTMATQTTLLQMQSEIHSLRADIKSLIRQKVQAPADDNGLNDCDEHYALGATQSKQAPKGTPSEIVTADKEPDDEKGDIEANMRISGDDIEEENARSKPSTIMAMNDETHGVPKHDRVREHCAAIVESSVNKIKDEVRELREEVADLHGFLNMLVCPTQSDKNSSITTPTTSTLKSASAAETRSTSKPAPNPYRRSSAFATEKAKGSATTPRQSVQYSKYSLRDTLPLMDELICGPQNKDHHSSPEMID